MRQRSMMRPTRIQSTLIYQIVTIAFGSLSRAFSTFGMKGRLDHMRRSAMACLQLEWRGIIWPLIADCLLSGRMPSSTSSPFPRMIMQSG
jgi:hypothetical protein